MPPREAAEGRASPGADASAGDTSFIDVLRVPNLARFFAQAVEHHMDRHQGLNGSKKLRSLSQGARSAMQQAVHGYSVKLGDVQAHHSDPRLVEFLNRCHLRWLQVTVPPMKPATGECT